MILNHSTKPEKSILTILQLVTFILSGNFLDSQNTWSQKANYPGGAIYFGSSFVINGEGYKCKSYE